MLWFDGPANNVSVMPSQTVRSSNREMEMGKAEKREKEFIITIPSYKICCTKVHVRGTP